MAISLITFTDKEDRRELDSIPAVNKVTAADMNMLKDVINEIANLLNNKGRRRLTFTLTSASFSGSNYQNANLVGKTYITDFMLWTNDGSGVLMKEGGGGFTFNNSTGTITGTPGNYILEIYLALDA